VATLVADGTPPAEVFAAVTEEIGRLLPVDFVIMTRYEHDSRTTILAFSGLPEGSLRIGSRSLLGGNNVSTLVFETGRPARVDSYGERSSGAVGEAGRARGVRSTVATPITVDGQVWGAMIVGTALEQSLPPDSEDRLGSFTELVATAIANAESRARLARLAEEQAALRRVATLVAQSTPPEDLFTAVVEEVGQLFPVHMAMMGRYEAEGTLACVATWGVADSFPAGSRRELGGSNLGTIVCETGRSARLDDYSESASGQLGDIARVSHIRSSVATPIMVEGRLWGLIAAGSMGEEPLPADSEARLASFTELVATAIANAESRVALARLADEQAALRRVATLVARGVSPEEVFAAVTEEIGLLLPVNLAILGRFEGDGTGTCVASWGAGSVRFPVGSRWPLDGNNLATVVFETGGSVRNDEYADSSGKIGVTGRESGFRSGVGTPIVVEGDVWGVMVVGSTREPRLPADTEARLTSFTELVGTAIANAESGAALAASRARIVAASDESRRRIERDLHDGAQQRLVHAVIVLKLAMRALSRGDAGAGELVAEALQHAEQASFELRELAHGILPAALRRGGLGAGVDSLVSRVSLPVTVDVTTERLPASIEAAAYFVVSEALTNVVKHAGAAHATVTARVQDGELEVEVCDDGVGGARSAHDTGLGGLEDRVTALDGRLELESPAGAGTRVRATLRVSGEL
jgi:signal transduction histidine kinase